MLDDRHAQPPAMLTVIKSWFELAQISCRSSRAVFFAIRIRVQKWLWMSPFLRTLSSKRMNAEDHVPAGTSS